MITRRRFCVGAGCGLAALGVGCGNDPRVTLGAVDDPVLGGDTDAGTPPPPPSDGGPPPSPDLAHHNTATCPSSPLNAGAASAIAVNGAKRFTDNQTYDLFVCRDANGYFSVDAECTHSGCVLKLSGGGWFCNCHGARFNFDGTHPTLPAFTPLPNYAVCVDASGTVWVDFNSRVSSTTRA